MQLQLLTAYGIGINLLSFYLMAYDKSQARKGGRRVPERNLFIAAAVGGALGSLLGMRLWRHKTKHLSFTIGIPLILVIQGVILYSLLSDSP